MMSNRIPIFLSADNNYAPFVATTIASICDNTKSFCDFYVLDGGIAEENKAKICELKKKFDNFSLDFILINEQKLFADFQICRHYSKTMYARFLIPQIKPNLEKVLYSDVDVIVLGDIKTMYDENLEGYALGAVPEYFENKILYPNRHILTNKHFRFASGNLLINCKKWINEKILEQCIETEKKYRNVLKYPDQDILNIVFCNNYKKLEPRYCYTIQNDVCFPVNDVVICHYNGEVKPWQISEDVSTNLIPYFKKFWDYAKSTSFYDSLKQQIDNKKQNNYLHQLKLFRTLTKINYNR